MKRLALLLVACLALIVAGCGSSDDSSSSSESTATSTESSEKSPAESGESAEKQSSGGEKTKPKVTVPSGPPPKQLEIKEIEKGSGKAAKAGDEVLVQYVGVGYESEEEFDSSWSRNEPFPLTLGAGGVIPGWEKGIEGMKVGGRRELIIPPNLAYGAQGSPPVIGPNETLIFVIDLLAVK
ncbi:MAG TPA: FKBP-type peptidyl-prolyl cis-trans isomerase [Solirubrobacterales bacterium]|nr:FKBP-type peptidyl-prolyl cis-trans isomerase [Solirubrobacterales bacterium]